MNTPPGSPMMNSRRLHPCLAFLLPGLVAFVPFGCDNASPPADKPSGALVAAVSILPQAEFLRRIGGSHIQPIVLVGPGQSPATFDPTLKQMTGLARARLYFRIGVAFEGRLVAKIQETYPDLQIIDTRQGIELRSIEEGDDPEHHHHAGEPDPHIWLNPRLVKTQSRTICDALKLADPDHAADFERNLGAFEADLDAVDARIAKRLAPVKGREFFVFHPAFGYFGDAYGLRQVAVEIGGKEPTARQLSALIERARKQNVKLILVQRQFATAGARAVADAIGGAVLVVDPLAEDYLDNLWRIASTIAELLEHSQQTPSSQAAGSTVGKTNTECSSVAGIGQGMRPRRPPAGSQPLRTWIGRQRVGVFQEAWVS